MNIIIYDLEIIRGIPNRDGSKEDGIEYCGGWHDHANMGISVNGVYDYHENRYRVFTEDNRDEWAQLLKERDPVAIGFNSIPFDNAVLSATGWATPNEARCYDVLRELWAAAGLGPAFSYPSHAGYGLDDTCKANSMPGKTGNGALAPVLWQRGQVGKVIDYCLTDVHRTKLLVDRIMGAEGLYSPKNGEWLAMRDVHDLHIPV
jgi:hypothetical protein